MKGSNAKRQQWTLKERASLGFLGALVMGTIRIIGNGAVFAPFAVLVGSLILFVAIKGGRS
jgi:hypothetical protein